MLVTSECWWLYDNFWMLVTEFRYWSHLLNVRARCLCKKIENVDDENGRNRHLHLKIVIDTFSLQHPSPTSM